jgi:hypothetical protein
VAQLRPTRVADGASEAAVADHVPDREILDRDHVVVSHEPGGELVRVILPPVGDATVDARDPVLGFRPVRRPLLLAGQRPLRPREPLAVDPFVARVDDLVPGGQGDQAGDPGVDTDRRVGLRGVVDGGLHQDRDVVLAPAGARHRDLRRDRAVGQRAGPADVQRLVLHG